jgi:hypothetical protein
MAREGKYLSLLLVAILTVSIFLIVKPSDAQSIPQFTLTLANHPFTVPAGTSIDENGQIHAYPSRTADNYTIDITINNQPFAMTDELTNLYYNIRVKGHLKDDWCEYFFISDNTTDNTLVQQSTTEKTMISIPRPLTEGDQIDIQVKAVIATEHLSYPVNAGYWAFKSSGWSSTQTVTDLTSDISTPTPSVPEFSWLTIIPILLTIPIALILARKRHTAKNLAQNLSQ